MRDRVLLSTKVFNVQQAGAEAAIVYNFAGMDDLVLMGAGTSDPITIPSLFVGYETGQMILGHVAANVTISPLP